MPVIWGGMIDGPPPGIVLSNDGRRWACSNLVLLARGLRLGLFVNDLVPQPSNVLSDFTAATFDSYAPKVFGLWGETFLNTAGNAESDYPLCSWLVGSGGGVDTVYGYYVFDAQGFVLWSERDPRNGVPMNRPGDRYLLVPRFMAGALC